jgi:hypothetical protein
MEGRILAKVQKLTSESGLYSATLAFVNIVTCS